MDLQQLKEAQEVLEERARADEKLVSLFRQIIRLASNLRPALEQPSPDSQGLHDALAATRGGLLEMLRTEGVRVFGETGDPVVPGRHTIVEVRDPPRETLVVVQVVCEGLEWKSKVIHKAEVIASRVLENTEGKEA